MRRGSPFSRRHDFKNSKPGNSYAHYTDDGEDITLFTQKSKTSFLEKEVKSEDTLQSIALEFNTTVGELKRVNNIHKENEIHARRVIKVPARPFSLLINTEIDDINQNEAVTSHTNHDITTNPLNKEEEVLINEVTNAVINESSSVLSLPSTSYFKPVQEDEEVTDLENVNLLRETEPIVVTNIMRDSFTCNGADWGVSWPVIIVLALLVAIGGPVYIYYAWFFIKS